MKPNKENVGKRIREIRTNLGYSMDEFGKLIGDSPRSSVNNWEKGISIPKKDKLDKIALLGNTIPEQILYGHVKEYLYDLINQNFDVRFSDNILHDIFMAIPPENRSYDDILWLAVAKYFIENGTYGRIANRLVYTSMIGIENLYAARSKNEFIEQRNDYDEFEILHYVYVDVEKNRLHVIPFTLKENNKKLFFKPPTFIKEKENHHFFTENFDKIGLQVNGSTIIFYGIDVVTLEESIQVFEYDVNNDSYVIIPSDNSDYFESFYQELQKEIKEVKEEREKSSTDL